MPHDGGEPAHNRIQVNDRGYATPALDLGQHLPREPASLPDAPLRPRELLLPLLAKRLAAELLQAARCHHQQVYQLMCHVGAKGSVSAPLGLG